MDPAPASSLLDYGLLLARIQFAFTVSFHIIFPAFTIGVSAFVATLLLRWQWTGREHYRVLARMWTKVFAVSFAMGVVSGIVLSYQFGTNWSRFSVVVGNVIGPLIGYEVLTAFFLEATFLGILLFGWNRVPAWLHVFAACAVAVGTSISMFWILSANSWMHTPAGHEIRDGVAYPVEWFDIVFNPSFPTRFAHMGIAAYLTVSLVVLAIGARYLLARVHETEAKTMMRMGAGMLIALAPLQIFVGDLSGLVTAKHQPAKLAAMEAHWDGSKPADLILFAWPDAAAEKNHFEIGIPKAGSLIITHDPNGLFPGLKDFPRDQRPPIWPVFWAFRVMVAVGLALLAIGVVACWLWWRGKLFETRWFLKPVGYAWPLGFVGILAGWFTTEIGRQPWVAYGILRTADAASPVSAAAVAVSLLLFVGVYCVVFGVGIWYVRRLVAKGPQPEVQKAPHAPQGLPNRPLSTADEAVRDDPTPGAGAPGPRGPVPGESP
jgi:cytochrome d ubiquinol oxidase subunit I